VTTSLGDIHIDLFPEAAPNHVRSFIALAKAGYFDGLPFYGRDVVSEDDKVVAGLIYGGCPKGTGEAGYGSIGYWLKPEIKGNPLSHEAGAIGAWHAQELETAACRFYITTEKLTDMDGGYTMFGKVSRGLDVVRTINAKPVDDNTHQLKEPVPIKSVAIEVVEDGAASALHAN
jgi:peptidyl-prolyl cis-trans isomerase B (cyclophilin B)